MIVPLSVRSPVVVFSACAVSVPTDEVPNASALESTTLAEALVLSTTLPVKSLPVLLRSMPPAVPLTVKLAVPAPVACTRAPVWLIPPSLPALSALLTTVSVPLPTLEVPRTRAFLSEIDTLLAPVLVRLTAPLKSLPVLVSVTAKPPVVKLEVPGTVKAPLWVITPPAVTDKLPPACSVAVGSATAALSYRSVRLRRLVSALSVGTVALALVLRSPTSRMLAGVPPNPTAPLRLLACVLSKMSLLAAVTVSVTAPAAAWVIAPVSVMLPPAVIPNVPVPTLEAPNTMALVSVTATLLLPVLLSETASVKSLPASVRVMVLAPALKLEVPLTAMPPAVSLMAPPLLVADKLPPTVPLPTLRAPVEITVRSPPTLKVPSVKAFLSVI